MNIRVIAFFLICFSIHSNTLAQVYGCTDPLAVNFDPLATANDGSCNYNAASVAPSVSYTLDGVLHETSGLIYWDNKLYTHNDNSDINLYAIDTANGALQTFYALNGVVNNDWEEIAQDSNYIYVGDFGNNANGNRTNLQILRVEKNSLLQNQPVIDTIRFSYADQTNFNPTGGNNTDFDCEAFIVDYDSIFLFTKQWVSKQTVVYGFPKLPGVYSAQNLETYNVDGLITGATFMRDLNLVVLSGYSPVLQPFLYCLYDFNGTSFFTGNKRKLELQLPFHQIEGIATNNGLKYYLSNEYFTQAPLFSVDQKMHIVDLSGILGNYISSVSVGIPVVAASSVLTVYPNPASDELFVSWSGNNPVYYVLIDGSGRTVHEGTLYKGNNIVCVDDLSDGNYFLKTSDNFYQVVSIIR